MKKVYVLLADGFETIEALAPVDVMRRSGVDVKTVSVGGSRCAVSSHGVSVNADMLLADSLLDDGDAVVLPGGYPGYENLGMSEAVGRVVKSYFQSGRYVAAICGAPTVLAKNDVAKGRRVTCHTTVRDMMDGYTLTDEPVVVDGNLITGVGAGYSVDFALALARLLTDAQTVATVRRKMELD